MTNKFLSGLLSMLLAPAYNSRRREARAERDRALMDAEFLAVSHKLADSPDVLVDARRHIAQLIRNIDRCLVMLKE